MTSLDFSTVGKKQKREDFKYNWKDAALYAVGIGASAKELPFVYEGISGGMKVFPSFATIAAGSALVYPGNIDFSRFLHGEMSIKVYQPFPNGATIRRETEISNIYDKGKGALIVTTSSGYLENGNKLYDAIYGFFYLGEGGFGGEPGPKSIIVAPPEGTAPDFSVTYQTTENQAVLYRLNGDTNPLHIDPEFARKGGQAKPILHGLCTYGFATRAVVYEACNGDVSLFKEFTARFTNVVYPGENLTIDGWKTGDRYIVQVRTDRVVMLGSALVNIA
ncbi:MAG: MaoC family dehydratase N-terminal domain-containing protein [Candidatus Lokiarchaeota archaeon]|nr:MaoC family dehydratase N-terminal domain-containing protein [Candidatus Lokiarchaeota archaeon]